MIQPVSTASLPASHYRKAVSTFFFIAGFTFASWASRIPDIKLKLQLSDGGLGSVLFALPVGLMLSMPFSGYLVSRFGSRLVVVVVSMLYPIVLTFLGLVNAPWQLASVLFCFGFLGNLFNISVNTQGVGVESMYGRSIMASFHGLWSLAGFSGAAVGTLMVSVGASPFIHYCIILLLCVLLSFIAMKYLLPADANSGASQPLFAKPDSSMLKIGLIAFGCLVCEGTMFDWSGVYFQKVVKVKESMITTGYVAFMLMMASGRFIADWMVLHLGVKRMLQGSGIIIAIGLLTAVLFPNIITATISFAFVGLGVSSVVPLVYGLAGKSTTMPAGMALAAVSTIGFLGFLLGPPLIGFIAEMAGLRWSFTVIALIGLSTTVLATAVKIGHQPE